MEKQTDLRVVKTKKLIKAAFYELASQKSFEKITVSDIAYIALINRATFYLHYEDKYNLLRELEKETISEIKAITDAIEVEQIQSRARAGAPLPHVVKILEYVNNNTDFFNLIITNNIDPSFFNELGGIMNKTAFEITGSEPKESDRIYTAYINNVNSAIFLSIITQWIKTGKKETVEEIAAFVTKLAWSSLNVLSIR